MPRSGEEWLEMESGNPRAKRVLRGIELPGVADLEVFAEAEPPSAALWLEVFDAEGGLLTEGKPPFSLLNLPAGAYVLALRIRQGKGRVRLVANPDLHDPDARSGPEAFPEGALLLESGKSREGRVDWFGLRATEFYKIRSSAGGLLEVSLSLSQRAQGAVSFALLSPGGERFSLEPGEVLRIEGSEEGKYLLRVRAGEMAAASYQIQSHFRPFDPDGSPSGALPVEIKGRFTLKGELNASAGDEADWFRFELSSPALLKLARTEGGTTDGPRLSWWSGEAEKGGDLSVGDELSLEVGRYFFEVFATSKSRQAYSFAFQAREEFWIDASLLERDRRGGCALLMDRGARHGVQKGASVRLLRAGAAGAGGDNQARSRHVWAGDGQGRVEKVFPKTALVLLPLSDCEWGRETQLQIRVLSVLP